jgi:hypothetical protein
VTVAPAGPIVVNSLAITINGTASGGAAFTHLPTSCSPATTTVTVTTHTGGAGSGSDSFTPTCSGLGFSPTITAAATKDPGDAGASLEVKIVQPSGQAAATTASVTLPAATIRLNTAAVDRLVCSDPTLVTCKSIGQIRVKTPLLAQTLAGAAYLLGTSSSPFITATFPVPFRFTLTGAVDVTNDSITFHNMPDLPLSSLDLALGGGSQALFATKCAARTGTVTTSLFAHNNANAHPSASVTVSGCTGGGGGAGKPSESGASISGLAKGKARLSFRLSAGSQAPKIKSFAISLPGGLSFAKSFAKGLALHGGGKYTATLSHGRLTISLKTAATSVGVVLNNKALTVSKTLASQEAKHKVKTLRFTTRVTDASGKTTTITLTLKVS